MTYQIDNKPTCATQFKLAAWRFNNNLYNHTLMCIN